jgi:type IV secretory pathway VirB4 component
MFGNEVTAQFFQELYKRARKYGGVPTGITQNVEDLLKSYTARTMLSNSEFLIMMKQSMSDRRELVELRHLSKTEAQYFTTVTAGQGVIDFGGIIIPTDFKIDNDTELYSYLTTKISEVKTADTVENITNEGNIESYDNAFERSNESQGGV